MITLHLQVGQNEPGSRATKNIKLRNQALKISMTRILFPIENHSKEPIEPPLLEINANSKVHPCEGWCTYSYFTSASRREDRGEAANRFWKSHPAYTLLLLCRHRVRISKDSTES